MLLAGLALTAVYQYLVPPEGPENFNQAKQLLRDSVYQDQNKGADLGTLYCGCDWQWAGRTGGRVETQRCGYEIRRQRNRGERIEWEHIVPASWFGQQRQCWQDGGRQNCTENDAVFSRMEADLHNLTPVVGELNADRSNYRFGIVTQAAEQYGRCQSKTDFQARTFEPRDEAKGFVARVSFYMHDQYGLSMSAVQQRLLSDWHKRYPVTSWELERNHRIARLVGHGNPYVTGERTVE